MRRFLLLAVTGAMLLAIAFAPSLQGDEADDRSDGPPPRGEYGPPPGHHPPPPHPLERALDTDGDGELSAEEIAGAVEALKKADRNGDGKLSGREMRPPRPPHGPPPERRERGDEPPPRGDRRPPR